MKQFKKGDIVTISAKRLWEVYGEDLTFVLCDRSFNNEYDLLNKDTGEILCKDGEKCILETDKIDFHVQLRSLEENQVFSLDMDELGTAAN